MMSYQRSEEHIKNAENARKLALIAAKQAKINRIEEYYKDPSKCHMCKNTICYEKKNTKFCTKSCAAKFNNIGRTKSKESKKKTSESVKEFFKTHDNPRKGIKLPDNLIKKYKITCKVCNSIIEVTHKKKEWKTCGKSECKIQASIYDRSYRNKHRKNVKYFCKELDKEITLESSWEVKLAEWLDTQNLRWTRPKHIKWVDSTGKLRYYFPDFYLIDHNVYLDPKNPYCMKLDQEKLSKIISDGHKIYYGDLQKVKQEIIEYLNKDLT
jgi:hypothetical protein